MNNVDALGGITVLASAEQDLIRATERTIAQMAVLEERWGLSEGFGELL